MGDTTNPTDPTVLSNEALQHIISELIKPGTDPADIQDSHVWKALDHYRSGFPIENMFLYLRGHYEPHVQTYIIS